MEAFFISIRHKVYSFAKNLANQSTQASDLLNYN